MLKFYSYYINNPPLRYEYVKTEEWREDARQLAPLLGLAGRVGYSNLRAAEWLIVEHPEQGGVPPERLSWPKLHSAATAGRSVRMPKLRTILQFM